MQPIGTIITTNLQKTPSGALRRSAISQTTSSSSKGNEGTNKRIDLLFSKFAAFYGHVWRSQFKSEGFIEFAKKEWQEALKDFTDEIFNKAIVNCLTQYELPPTLGQLIQLCQDAKKNSLPFVIKEAGKPCNPAIALAHLKACKDILNGQKETISC